MHNTVGSIPKFNRKIVDRDKTKPFNIYTSILHFWLGFMCMFCRSLFVLLSFFFWPLCFLSFSDLRILINPFGVFKLFSINSGCETSCMCSTLLLERHVYHVCLERVSGEGVNIMCSMLRWMETAHKTLVHIN